MKALILVGYLVLIQTTPPLPNYYSFCIDTLGSTLSITACALLLNFLNSQPPAQKNLLNRLLAWFTSVLILGTVRDISMSFTTCFFHDDLQEFLDMYRSLAASFLSIRLTTVVAAVAIFFLSAGRLLLFTNPAYIHTLNPTRGLVIAIISSLIVGLFDLACNWITCYAGADSFTDRIVIHFQAELGLSLNIMGENYTTSDKDKSLKDSDNEDNTCFTIPTIASCLFLAVLMELTRLIYVLIKRRKTAPLMNLSNTPGPSATTAAAADAIPANESAVAASTSAAPLADAEAIANTASASGASTTAASSVAADDIATSASSAAASSSAALSSAGADAKATLASASVALLSAVSTNNVRVAALSPTASSSATGFRSVFTPTIAAVNKSASKERKSQVSTTDNASSFVTTKSEKILRKAAGSAARKKCQLLNQRSISAPNFSSPVFQERKRRNTLQLNINSIPQKGKRSKNTQNNVPEKETVKRKYNTLKYVCSIAKELFMRPGSFITLGALIALVIVILNVNIVQVAIRKFFFYYLMVLLVSMDKDVIQFYK